MRVPRTALMKSIPIPFLPDVSPSERETQRPETSTSGVPRLAASTTSLTQLRTSVAVRSYWFLSTVPWSSSLWLPSLPLKEIGHSSFWA